MPTADIASAMATQISVFGEDHSGPKMYWWETRCPFYAADKPWVRREIKALAAFPCIMTRSLASSATKANVNARFLGTKVRYPLSRQIPARPPKTTGALGVLARCHDRTGRGTGQGRCRLGRRHTTTF